VTARRALLLAIAASLVAAPARGEAPLPVQVLSIAQAAQVSGFPAVSLAAAQFTTAAFVDVASKPSQSKKDVERDAALTAAAYGGLSLQPVSIQPPPAPADSAPPPSTAHFDFKKTEDAAQGWATMSAAGTPFLELTSFGQSSASGTASWTAHVPMPATASHLYVQFRLPAATVTGFTEQNKTSPWQSRFRAELMLNGFPVWNSEASRVAEVTGASSGTECPMNGGGHETSKTLVTFGTKLGFSAADAEQASTPKIVTIDLGALPANQVADVSLVVRSDAEVVDPCCARVVDPAEPPEFFCTRASASVAWDDTPDPVHFWVGPAVAPTN
jgi:hypothetical protein